MGKIKLNVNKLGDPTVNYISLVSRGANRIPFRIVKHEKQESSMIDLASLNLSKLFKTEKAAESTTPQPAIVGFVTMKDENFDLVKKHLKDAGFKISSIAEEADGSVVFKQQDEMPEEFAVLKMSDALLVLVDNLDAEGAVDGTIYESLLKEDSFLPSQTIASQGMTLAMEEISAANEPTAEKVAKMELVTKDYNDYLAKLFSWVPSQLNVMAGMLDKEIKARSGIKPEATVEELRGVISASPEKADDSDQNINQEAGVEAKGTPAPIALDNAMPKDLSKNITGVTKEEAVVAPVAAEAAAETVEKAVKAKAKPECADTDGDEDDAKKQAFNFAKKSEENTAALLKKMEEMFGTLQASINEEITKQVGAVSATVSELNTAVENIQKSQDILHDRVVETEKIAKSADSVVRGKLITSDAAGDGTTQGVRKAEVENEGFSGQIDTAFQQTVRKMARPIQRGRAIR